MKFEFVVYYHVNGKICRYNFIFSTLFGACYVAKKISYKKEIIVDVINNFTGEVVKTYC